MTIRYVRWEQFEDALRLGWMPFFSLAGTHQGAYSAGAVAWLCDCPAPWPMGEDDGQARDRAPPARPAVHPFGASPTSAPPTQGDGGFISPTGGAPKSHRPKARKFPREKRKNERSKWRKNQANWPLRSLQPRPALRSAPTLCFLMWRETQKLDPLLAHSLRRP